MSGSHIRRYQARPSRSCSKLSLAYRQREDKILVSFVWRRSSGLCAEDDSPLWQSWVGLARRRSPQHFAGASNRIELTTVLRSSAAAAELSAASSLFERTLQGHIGAYWHTRICGPIDNDRCICGCAMQTGQHGSAANKEQSSHGVSSSAEQRAGNWLDDTNSLAVYSPTRASAS